MKITIEHLKDIILKDGRIETVRIDSEPTCEPNGIFHPTNRNSPKVRAEQVLRVFTGYEPKEVLAATLTALAHHIEISDTYKKDIEWLKTVWFKRIDDMENEIAIYKQENARLESQLEQLKTEVQKPDG